MHFVLYIFPLPRSQCYLRKHPNYHGNMQLNWKHCIRSFSLTGRYTWDLFHSRLYGYNNGQLSNPPKSYFTAHDDLVYSLGRMNCVRFSNILDRQSIANTAQKKLIGVKHKEYYDKIGHSIF